MRLKTWPLAAFFIGFMGTGPKGMGSVQEWMIVSVGVGVVLAILGLIGAATLGRRRGPTKSALPYTGNNEKRDLMFNLFVTLSVVLKLIVAWGALVALAGFAPAYIVLRGRKLGS